jgi:hypothetical protein
MDWRRAVGNKKFEGAFIVAVLAAEFVKLFIIQGVTNGVLVNFRFVNRIMSLVFISYT